MARPSAIYRSSQQQAQLNRVKYKFPILDPQELVMLYDTMGFDIDESMLMRPSSSFMKSLIEQIIDKFLYISPYSLREKISNMEIESNNNNDNNTDDMLNESDKYYDIRPSINVVASQRIMYKFLCDCGIDDFSIRDVAKPEHTRLRIILSALINYARFREERMGDLDELMDNNDKTLENYKSLIRKNHELESQIEKINIALNNQNFTLDELHKNNEDLENELRNLRIIQKQLTDDHENYKSEKTGLINELENQSALYIETEKDLEQIRPYIKESPESVKELIQKMKDSEAKETNVLRKLEQSLRDMNISLESFQILIQDLSNLQKTLQDLKSEAIRNKSYDENLRSLKSQINQTKEQANDYNRKISQLERQLKHNEDRIAKLKVFYSEKMKSLDEKLTNQAIEFNDVKSQKNVDDIELTKKEAQINDWMNKISDIQKQYEFECKDANFEFEKLNSKIQMYIGELKNKIDSTKDLLNM